mgnify:CR=1 FL=1
MSTYNEKRNYNFQERMVKKRKFISATPVLVEELRHRLEMTDFYGSEKELNSFVSYAKKFDNPGRALSLLHNCHVMRTNNGYPSKPKHIVQALMAVVVPEDPTMALEKAIEKLSANIEYTLSREELGLGALKERIEGMVKKPKKHAGKKHNEESEDGEEGSEDEPSEEDLKQLEEKLDKGKYEGDDE